MERAKRLELITLLLQAAIEPDTYDFNEELNAAGHAQAENRDFPLEKLQQWAAELDEIVRAWPITGAGLQQGLMAIVRAQSSHASGSNISPG